MKKLILGILIGMGIHAGIVLGQSYYDPSDAQERLRDQDRQMREQIDRQNQLQEERRQNQLLEEQNHILRQNPC